jgi:hypothetical protein
MPPGGDVKAASSICWMIRSLHCDLLGLNQAVVRPSIGVSSDEQ